MKKNQDNNHNISKEELNHIIKKAIIKFSILFIILGLCFFLPAGTLLYWEAWLFLFTFLIPMLLILRYLIKNDPIALKRRLEYKEERKEQKLIIYVANILFIGLFLIPGFDERFNWSSVPFWWVIVADIIFVLGYNLFFLVMKENSYASRTIKVEKDVQKVITTGPYSIVRHPLYLSVMIMFGIVPLALGSYWGLLFDVSLFIMLPLRIKDEEKLLKEELKGYKEYMEKTKYRLIPYIW